MQDASGQMSAQRCVRAPSRTCVLELARTLANTPGLLSAAERERFEAEIIYADRPERLLANGLPQVDLGADWPTVDRELVDALVKRERVHSRGGNSHPRPMDRTAREAR